MNPRVADYLNLKEHPESISELKEIVREFEKTRNSKPILDRHSTSQNVGDEVMKLLVKELAEIKAKVNTDTTPVSRIHVAQQNAQTACPQDEVVDFRRRPCPSRRQFKTYHGTSFR